MAEPSQLTAEVPLPEASFVLPEVLLLLSVLAGLRLVCLPNKKAGAPGGPDSDGTGDSIAALCILTL